MQELPIRGRHPPSGQAPRSSLSPNKAHSCEGRSRIDPARATSHPGTSRHTWMWRARSDENSGTRGVVGKRKAVSAKGHPEKSLLVAKKKRRLRCHQDGAVSTGESGRRRHAARNMLDRGNNCAGYRSTGPRNVLENQNPPWPAGGLTGRGGKRVICAHTCRLNFGSLFDSCDARRGRGGRITVGTELRGGSIQNGSFHQKG